MAIREGARLFCLFVAGTVVCAAHQDQRTTAMYWADHYAVVYHRFEIEQNIRGGVAYLARLLKLFDGDLRLVAAAYLTGENRILPAGLAYSNAEVFQYVSKVARLYREKRLKRLQTDGLAQDALEGGNQP